MGQYSKVNDAKFSAPAPQLPAALALLQNLGVH